MSELMASLCLGFSLATVDAWAQAPGGQAPGGVPVEKWCANQGARMANEETLRVSSNAAIETHYNARLHTCFMTIETQSGTIETKMLLDAYAQRTFASYFSMRDKPSMTTCVLMPDTKDQKRCNSREEFDSFIELYLEK
jgi:hypothetical protein